MALSAPGCDSKDALSSHPEINLTAAKRFKPFTLYYAGLSFGDLRLTGDGSDDLRGYRRGSDVNFIYGTCEPDPGGETGCAPPAAIQNFPICKENLSRYRAAARPKQILTLRGVPAAVFRDYGGVFDKVEVFTGGTTVVLFVNDLGEARALVDELEPVNRRSTGRNLPEPLPGAVEGKRPACRSKTARSSPKGGTIAVIK